MAFSKSYDTANPGAAVLNREDLTGILTTLAPKQTPVLSQCAKLKAQATLHEWGTDDLATPDTSGVFEGEDIQNYQDKFENQARLGNYIQGFQRPWRVSQVQEAVEKAGDAGVAKAQVKSMRELKRDIEAVLVSDNDRQAGSAGAKYKTRGLGDWIDNSGPSDVPAQYRTPAAQIVTGSTLGEDDMQNILGSMYRVSGEMNNVALIADTAVRNVVSNFTRLSSGGTNTQVAVQSYDSPASAKKITLAVDFFESDYGMVRIQNSNPDCSPSGALLGDGDNDRSYFINFDYLHVADLIPTQNERQENKGGGDRGFVECWLALGCRDPRAHGKHNAS